MLGQLLNDPFLSEKSVSMEVEPSPTSPAPLIQAEHSYSLCEEPRAQSPFTHVTSGDSVNDGKSRARAAPGTMALSSSGVRSECYTLVGPHFSPIRAPRKAWGWGCGEMQKGGGHFSTPGRVVWELAVTEWLSLTL